MKWTTYDDTKKMIDKFFVNVIIISVIYFCNTVSMYM